MKAKSLISEKMMRRRACALVLAITLAFSPSLAAAGAPTIPGFYGTVKMPNAPVAGTLPNVRSAIGATVGDKVGTTLTITQNQSQATIDWNSFNVAPDSVVLFNQKLNGVPQPQWAALNRIYDANPSLIFGKLQADGKIYLINRNGILFGPNSQVDTHSLVASNLNITDLNFKAGKLRFTAAPYNGTLADDAYVSNYGTITTDSGGSVFLVGPNVVNAGTISAPSGKINLIGTRNKGDGSGEVETAELTTDATGNDLTYSDINVPGAVYNAAGGTLKTENGGRIGMYGATVQNDGLIRSVTAFKKGGVVILAARDKVTTGIDSKIDMPIATSIDPATGKAEAADPQFVFNHPEVIVKGLSTNNLDSTGNPVINPLSIIEHEGTIVAPSGNVTFTARDKIFLGDSSKIDVAGLWLDRDASANQLEAQLNSVDLRDDFGQKNGTVLGQKITVDLLNGSNIGNLKNNYLTLQTGAEERSTRGGHISFSELTDEVALGQLIVKQGATLDFSGGGIRYGTGAMTTSRLVSGNKIYDIGSAPHWLAYDRLVDMQTKIHSRFGITEEFKGLYFGGGSSVQDLTAGRVVGSDAGAVLFNARVAALDGTLIGTVTRGQYQTAVTNRYAQTTTTSGTPDNPEYLVSVARGLEEPIGGTVTVGNALPAAPAAQNRDNEKDFITTAITVTGQQTATSRMTDLDITKNISGPTEISATLMNSAGLSSLNLFANTAITSEASAAITLLPGGSYVARARRIDYSGTIDIPGGSVEMTTRPNASSYQTLTTKAEPTNPLYNNSLVENVHLTAGSRISTAGREIDNSAAGSFLAGATPAGHTAGGSILIQERTEQGTSATLGTVTEGHNLVVDAGASLDVSGGWLINDKGAISGGNAGTLDLKAPTLSLAGDLRGYSLPGKNGGEIKLHAGEVTVTARDLVLPGNISADGTVPDYLLGRLVLGENRLTDSGFSRITLTAINDLTFSDGAVLSPSLTKLPLPVPAIVSQSAKSGTTVVPAGADPSVSEYAGTTGITLVAGKNIYENSPLGTGGDSTNSSIAKIDLAAGTGITVASGGTVALSAPYIDIAGHIEAPGGGVTVKADQALTVKTAGQIFAGGYTKPVTTTVAGLPAGSTPQAGGKVTLESKSGDVVLEAGSRVDVSGSAAVERYVAGVDGTPVQVMAVADPGTLNLSYSGALTLDGEISGAARTAGTRGGNLSVTNSTNDLNIVAADIDRYQLSGFDALTFTSTIGALVFPDKLDVNVGRSLTLDSASLKGAPAGDVTMRSPWITVINTPNSFKDPSSGASSAGTGHLSLVSSGFLDVAGSVGLDGFSDVTLKAGRDIRLSDLLYTKTTNYAGDLRVGGDLTLQAARVYPTTATDFTIVTPGKVIILSGVSDTTPVYSAGGSLTIAANGGIEQRGTLEAPLGSITLDGGASGKVLLAEGSKTITGGSVEVLYGSYNGSTWTTRSEILNDGSIRNFGTDITAAPDNSVSLKGKDVVVAQNAAVDVSGGGSVYSAFFQSGIAGTKNPLAASTGRYVILPDNSVKTPGNAVYLDAVPALGLVAGVYSLLPADTYAAVPGALVVQDAGMQLVAGQRALSAQGYQVVAGYSTVMDTNISSQTYKGYTVRTAVDVLKEGDFTDKRSFIAGNGGDFSLTATSASLNGTLNAQPLQGFNGGVLTLSAKNVIAQTGAALSTAPVADTLIVDTTAVTGFGEVALGSKVYDSTKNAYTYTADSVTVESGSTLQATAVTLQAKNTVTVKSGAVVEASGGIATVNVPTGNFDLQADSQIRAEKGLAFNVGTMTLLGQFGGISLPGTFQTATSGSFSLTANNIDFANIGADPKNATFNGVAWNNIAGYDNLTLASRGDMNFQQNADMKAKGALTLDAGRFTTAAQVSDSFTATGTLTLHNLGAASNLQTLQPGTAGSSLKFASTKGGIDISPTANGIVFDQFRSVTLDSFADLTLRGAGTIKAAQDLNVTAARVTTSIYKHDADAANKTDISVTYTAAAITVDARNGAVSIAGNGGTAGTSSAPGGSLEIMGASITVGDPGKTTGGVTVKNSTLVEAPSAQVKLTATGDITMLDKSSILAAGGKSKAPQQPGSFSYSPGGQISAQSSGGSVNLATGSILDVSASDQGDAGAILLSAATQGVTLSGTVKGAAANGQGGSLAVDSATLAGVGGLDGLSTTLSGGGFTDKINIHSRSGDVTLSEKKTMSGREVVIAADGGAIDLSGTINANGVKSGDAGGRVELYAGTALTLQSTAVVTAKATKGVNGADGAAGVTGEKGKDGADGKAGGVGGTVLLSSLASAKTNGNYSLQIISGAKIDVGADGGDGGTGGAGGAGGIVGTKGKDGVNGINGVGDTLGGLGGKGGIGDLAGSGGNGGVGGIGGTVSFRAYEIAGSDANMAALPASAITGASRVTVEEAKQYVVDGNIGAFAAPYNAFMSDANMAALKTKLFTNVAAGDKANYHLQAGVELASAAGKDLTFDTAWDLSSVRPGGQVGVLTLRAGNNLNINTTITDVPTAMATLYHTSMQDSWGINLIAGASGGANYRASESGTVLAPKTGELTIAQNAIVYSENAPVTFAAAGNATFAGWSGTTAPGYMINNLMQYNLGSYGGTVRGTVGNDLNLVKNGSAIQTALGDINVTVGGNLNLGTQPKNGAIRTTGEFDNSTKVETMPGSGVMIDAGTASYWTYHNGGSINLDVGGSVNGNLNATNGWDGAYIDSTVRGTGNALNPWYLAAGFGGKENTNVDIPVTVGIATMGGGDIALHAGGSVLTQVGAFGRANSGNLNITSGGDMIGRYRVMNGTATLTSGGGFGSTASETTKSVIEMGAAQVSVAAQGDVNLGAVLNPDNSRDRIFVGGTQKWNMTYSKDANAAISSLAGNVNFYGTDGFNAYNFTGSSTLLSSLLDRQKILPATFILAAAGDLTIRNQFSLAPSTTGNLELFAGGSVRGSDVASGFKMIDVAVDKYYGRQADTGSEKSKELRTDPGDSDSAKSKIVNHLGDTAPAKVTAERDIDTLKLVLNKKAEITTAKGDITKLDFIGQNNSVNDVSIISAGGNIDQGILTTNLSEIMVGGPGTLLVEAGKDINLGNSKGIESIGNSYNSGFTGEKTDSAVIISAGAGQRMLPTVTTDGATAVVKEYFNILNQAGIDYTDFKNNGKLDEASRRIADARNEISKYYTVPEKAGVYSSGNISMTDSLIRSKKGDIYLMARSDVNVGRSSVSDSAQGKKDTGITTTFGGNLNIYSGRDLNVNESRTMTFMGGDIVIWSDQGDIKAGRGSKTALSSGGAAQEIRDENGVLIGLLYPAPSVGSGIRCSTYDPDGSTGPMGAPPIGNPNVFAPTGIVDAGEAGIAGGKVTIGATQVLNAQNISFSAGSVGVPTQSNTVSLGALGGNSNMTDSSKMIETASSGGAAKDTAKQKLAQATDDFLSKFLDVKVIGFDADTIPASDKDTPDELEKKKKKK
jgi:filamentous hemagglutinin family protein